MLSKDVSDHCHLLLKVGGWDWGLKPFRFNNVWLKNTNFKKLVEEWWMRTSVSGWMGFVLKEKLKMLKSHLKEWNKGEYEGMEERIGKSMEDIAALDEKGEEGALNGEELLTRKSLFGDLWRLLRAKNAMMMQRSCLRWLKEGDANSKYLHKCVKVRSSRNTINTLNLKEEWVETPNEVRRTMVAYFTNHVSSSSWERLKLDGVPFDTLSEGENSYLVAPFTLEEIERVVKESDGDKSPGPGGFNFAFVKKFRYLIKDEVCILLDQFHANEVVPKGLLSYFVALISKISSPLALKDFRPISLLGTLYKILSKVLA